MRKKIYAIVLVTVVIFCIFGCKKKQKQVIQETPAVETIEQLTVESTTSVYDADEISISLGEDTPTSKVTEVVEGDFEADLDSATHENEVSDESTIDFSVFSDLDFEESSSIFTVTSLENTLQDEDGVLTVYTKATGKLSGMPGTYTVVVPFSAGWRRGDRAHVLYKTCYYEDDEEGESLIVSDIIFIEKTDDKEVSRAQQLALEREGQAKRESEEAAAKAEIEESKKRAESEIARQKAEAEAIRRQAAITYEQQQAAVIESIKAKEAAVNAGVVPSGY